jgi:hypothetical protein
MWVPGAGSALLIPVSLATYLAGDAVVSMVFGTLQALLLFIYTASTVATAQMLVPPQMRAFTSAMLVLIVNILGLSLGPLVTGMVSDALQPAFGTQSLRYAISFSVGMEVVAAVCFFCSARYLVRELKGAAAEGAGSEAELARA